MIAFGNQMGFQLDRNQILLLEMPVCVVANVLQYCKDVAFKNIRRKKLQNIKCHAKVKVLFTVYNIWYVTFNMSLRL